MKLVLAVLFVFLAVALGGDDRRFKAHRMPHEVRFQDWMTKHNKNYASQAEYQTRLNNFIETTQRVAQLNAQSKAINSTATFALNKFSDLTLDEFSERLGMKGYKPTQIAGVPVAAPSTVAPPTSFDWRKQGGITAVKDQGQCGSCWAFSCTESIESVYIIKGGKKNQLPLAPQQIVDCDKNDGGCNGGDLPTCYQYVKSVNGLELETAYPYHARNQNCQAQPGLEQDPIKGFQYVIPQGGSETTMAAYVAANSPVSIIVDASSWSSYHSGVLSSKQCGHDLDHAVQAVGYNGPDTTGYWIVRNSWGADWGEAGFIRLQFGANTCGMESEVTVPTI